MAAGSNQWKPGQPGQPSGPTGGAAGTFGGPPGMGQPGYVQNPGMPQQGPWGQGGRIGQPSFGGPQQGGWPSGQPGQGSGAPPGFTHGGGLSTSAMVDYVNPTTGQKWTASHGGWQAPPGWEKANGGGMQRPGFPSPPPTIAPQPPGGMRRPGCVPGGPDDPAQGGTGYMGGGGMRRPEPYPGGGAVGEVGGISQPDPFAGVSGGRMAKAREFAASGKMGRAKKQVEKGGGKWSKSMHRALRGKK